MTRVANYMWLYSALLCEKIACAPGGHKIFMLTKLGGGGGAKLNRSGFFVSFFLSFFTISYF